MFSAQYGKVFTSPHYEKLHKVISIWICFDSNNENVNTINRYTINEENLTGNYQAPSTEYNLIDVITLFLGNDQKTDNALLKMLDKIFSKQYTLDEKLDYLEHNCGIPMTTTINKEVSEMCNYSAYIKAEGRAEGRAEEKTETAEIMLKDKEPLAKIQKYTQLSASRIKEIASSIGVAVVI